VSPGFHHRHSRLFADRARDGDEGDFGTGLLEQLESALAVEMGHAEIRDDDVPLAALQGRPHLGFGFDLLEVQVVTSFVQQADDQFGVAIRIFNNKDIQVFLHKKSFQ